MLAEDFLCYLVDQDLAGDVRGKITRRSMGELPPGDVLIRVHYSSLNYKDALAATGHPGVNRVFPHVPGVDAAGIVAESCAGEFAEGSPVLVTGFDMGANRWGGYAEYVRVPAEWIVPLPTGLTLRESMLLGTAGLTAGFCVHHLQLHQVLPDSGPVVVSGASGGVGSFAVAILARLGYRVSAVSGKSGAEGYLKSLGAAEVLPREAVCDHSDRPLLSRRWAGAVDTVGGAILSTLLRSTGNSGCVAACGNASGHDLPITVYPFILRGVALAGVDAAWCPLTLRHQTWRRLGAEWKPDCLATIARYVPLVDLPPRFADILAGRLIGRLAVVVSELQP